VKSISKQPEPAFVREFNENTPYDGINHNQHWGAFKDQDGYQSEVVDRLLADQGFLCAYCEIDIYRRDGVGGIQDIAVEHFHPKSSCEGSTAWVTQWSNLFAVCLGGSNKAVHEPSVRYSAPDLTCDKKKKNTVLDGKILNPLSTPSSPCLFKVKRSTGELVVNLEACANSGIDADLVECTINELNLNAARLKAARHDILNRVVDALVKLRKSGKTVPEAQNIVARARLIRVDEKYMPFFTACRAYLGSEAENVLASLSFNG
jgi:uncharacterized protein (TIGR02646 family)